MPEARDGGWEEQPHVQGAVAAWAQEGLEELFHITREAVLRADLLVLGQLPFLLQCARLLVDRKSVV